MNTSTHTDGYSRFCQWDICFTLVRLITAGGHQLPLHAGTKRLYPEPAIKFGSGWTRLRQTLWPIFLTYPHLTRFWYSGAGSIQSADRISRALDSLCLEEAPSSSYFNMQSEKIQWKSLSRSPEPRNDRVSSALSPNPPIHSHWLMLTKFPLSKKKVREKLAPLTKDFLAPSDHSLARVVTFICIRFKCFCRIFFSIK